MTGTFTFIEFWRHLRNPGVLVFTIGLPAAMFLIFGTAFDYADQSVGNGNVIMYVMLGMAAYGATMATNGIGGSAAVEQMQGWGRQVSLTPMTLGRFVAVKAAVAVILSLATVLVIFALGVATGARAEWWVWLASGLIAWLGSSMFALFGLAIGLLFRSEAAAGVSSGALVILGFLGNMFVPLSGALLTIAKFSPLFGYVALTRYPLTEGVDPSGATTPLWQLVANFVAWSIVFAGLAVWGAARSRGRQ